MVDILFIFQFGAKFLLLPLLFSPSFVGLLRSFKIPSMHKETKYAKILGSKVKCMWNYPNMHVKWINDGFKGLK